jgi:hypothetical protein
LVPSHSLRNAPPVRVPKDRYAGKSLATLGRHWIVALELAGGLNTGVFPFPAACQSLRR